MPITRFDGLPWFEAIVADELARYKTAIGEELCEVSRSSSKSSTMLYKHSNRFVRRPHQLKKSKALIQLWQTYVAVLPLSV
ncbi:MAG TPA: hypothetical protein VFN63_14010, partial [Pseudolabrys sp.]|nr:hypothetical protein [Pseudolabrys sp.]